MQAKDRSRDWFRQAQMDLKWGIDTANHGHHAQACFIAQQVCEKAIKALAYARGAELVKGHAILSTVRALNINDELEQIAMRLDQYYIAARYPDAQPEGIPSDYFTADQAREAISMAGKFMAGVQELMSDDHLA